MNLIKILGCTRNSWSKNARLLLRKKLSLTRTELIPFTLNCKDVFQIDIPSHTIAQTHFKKNKSYEPRFHAKIAIYEKGL